MHKVFFVSIVVASLLALTGCATSSTTNRPLSEENQIATIVAGTLSAVPSLTPIANSIATLAPEILPTSGANIQTYVDPEFGFKLQYDPSWHLDVKPGSGMTYYDGRGRTVWLDKNGYIFQLAVIGGPGDVENCAGLIGENPTGSFWVFRIDDVEIWRIKAEQGEINSFYDDKVSFLNIISPLEI